jgi:hypothetical protein
MKPVAYISDGGVIFKESPPDSILKLSPLYTSAEIQSLHNLVIEQVVEIESLGKAFEGERKYARYLSKLCIDNKIPIVWCSLKEVSEK